MSHNFTYNYYKINQIFFSRKIKFRWKPKTSENRFSKTEDPNFEQKII